VENPVQDEIFGFKRSLPTVIAIFGVVWMINQIRLDLVLHSWRRGLHSTSLHQKGLFSNLQICSWLVHSFVQDIIRWYLYCACRI